MLACLAGGGGACRTASVVAPPSQPASGPGGADYAHQGVLAQRFGEGAEEYWLFTPNDPVPEETPVVVFVHGWSGMNPRFYGAWIRHLVRKGQSVIYPRYQTTLFTPVDAMEAATLHAVQDALTRLAADGPVRPRRDRIAWVGHSLGGIIAANLASAYADHGLPPPAVLMAVAPGGETRLAVGDLSALPPDALVLLVVGDADRAVADRGVKAILASLPPMPAENMDVVTFRSDPHSSVELIANHLAPLAWDGAFLPDVAGTGDVRGGTHDSNTLPERTVRGAVGPRQANRYAPNALDYYGYWKLLDGLLDAAFRGAHREYALGDTPQQRYMGRFSDGVPVTPLEVASP